MDDIIARLEASAANGRARHAYLLTGPDTDRTDGVARVVASILLFGHKDVKRLADEPDYTELDGSISIAQFRDEIQPEIYRETYGKACRVVVFRNANLLSQMVQNAMLKVLEEPPASTHFILTGNEYGILPTIRSRCTIVRCPAPQPEALKQQLLSAGASSDEALRYSIMSGGVTKRAVRLYTDEQYRAMRQELYKGFLSALNGKPDYRFTKAKRERTDWIECTELLLLLAHDMLCAACGLKAEYCPDFAEATKKLGLYFTIGDIGCIIDMLTDAARRMVTNAGGGAVMDRLLSQAAEFALSRRGR